MSENYLDNLILTEYIHHIHVLEDPSERIPEVELNNETIQKEEKKSINIKTIEKNTKTKKTPETNKELIKLDIKESVIESQDKILTTDKISALEKGKNLLEFDYIPEKNTEEKKEPAKSELHFFNEWIDLLNKDGKYKMSKIEKKPNASGIKTNNKKNDLIKEFIETNPKITPISHHSADIKDFSEESIKEKTEFLTETLAAIYIKQKAYAKAISAYEKLSLKYPEKSTYFANQIKKIKKHIQ